MSDQDIIRLLRAKEAIKSIEFYLIRPVQVGDKTRAGVRFHSDILVDTLSQLQVEELIRDLNDAVEYTQEVWTKRLTERARELLNEESETHE